MKKQPIKPEDVKKIELDILKHIKKICDNNNIKYTLIYGTLLGAVRHKGFIPWDDDVDIALLWPDYIRLMDILAEDKKYKLYYDMTSSNYFYWFAKLVDDSTICYEPNKPKSSSVGVWVDIFPIIPINDSINTTDLIRDISSLNTKIFSSIGMNYCYDNNRFKSVIKSIVKLPRMFRLKKIGSENLKNQRRKLYTLGNLENCEKVGIIPTVYGEKSIYPKEIFKDFTSLVFEDTEFSVVKDWDKFLTLTYGDYMTPPPENKRITEHFNAYKIIR